jgi:hypothetical protein
MVDAITKIVHRFAQLGTQLQSVDGLLADWGRFALRTGSEPDTVVLSLTVSDDT